VNVALLLNPVDVAGNQHQTSPSLIFSPAARRPFDYCREINDCRLPVFIGLYGLKGPRDSFNIYM
jgi:hypothetical protein